MSPRTAITVALIAATILEGVYNYCKRRKIRMKLDEISGEVLRRDYFIAQSVINDDDLNDNQLKLREMLIGAGKYSYNTAG